jgi:hypothetical protein
LNTLSLLAVLVAAVAVNFKTLLLIKAIFFFLAAVALVDIEQGQLVFLREQVTPLLLARAAAPVLMVQIHLPSALLQQLAVPLVILVVAAAAVLLLQ